VPGLREEDTLHQRLGLTVGGCNTVGVRSTGSVPATSEANSGVGVVELGEYGVDHQVAK
jgi:hypothetical protein